VHALDAARVMRLTDGGSPDPQNARWYGISACTEVPMSMMQLVIGSALGFVFAQGALFAARQGAGWLGRGRIPQRRGTVTPPQWTSFLGGFVKYAGPIAAGVALLTLGAWAVSDYLAARSASRATLVGTLDAPIAAPVPALSPRVAADEALSAAAPRTAAPRVVGTAVVASVDPYADADFKVKRPPHRAGAAANLKDAYLERSEAKARAELLSETQQHLQRSQYDCEAADRAARYVKAGLDVWGFAAWQDKYFPVSTYKGATHAPCADIKNALDFGSLDLQTTMAQQNHP
jgi:hypothetical protein